MSMTFPPFMASRLSNGEPTAHVKRIEALPGWTDIPDHYFIKTDDDIDTLIARAQCTLVEASCTCRRPAPPNPIIAVDIAAAEKLAQADADGFMKARRWAQEAIDSGWYEASGG